MFEFTLAEYLLLFIPVILVFLGLVIIVLILATRRQSGQNYPDKAELERREWTARQIRSLEADHAADMQEIYKLRDEVFFLGRLISMMADIIEEAGLLLPEDVVEHLRRQHNRAPIIIDPETTVMVQHALDRFFDYGEINQLAFKLGIDLENIPGSTREDKTRGLVKFVDRRGNMEALIKLIVEMRPNVPLPWLGGRGPP